VVLLDEKSVYQTDRGTMQTGAERIASAQSFAIPAEQGYGEA
jgi:hypothetical protein